jgi:hypothetical protein
MSYFGQSINVGNQPIRELRNKLNDILRQNPKKEVWIGERVCDNECDSNYDPTCYCNTYSIKFKDKRIS